MSRILRTADDIRQWAEARGGQPAWSELPSGTRSQITLRIVFDQYLLNSGEAQDTDRPGGLDLVSWDEWIAEFTLPRRQRKPATKHAGITTMATAITKERGAERHSGNEL